MISMEIYLLIRSLIILLNQGIFNSEVGDCIAKITYFLYALGTGEHKL